MRQLDLFGSLPETPPLENKVKESINAEVAGNSKTSFQKDELKKEALVHDTPEAGDRKVETEEHEDLFGKDFLLNEVPLVNGEAEIEVVNNETESVVLENNVDEKVIAESKDAYTESDKSETEIIETESPKPAEEVIANAFTEQKPEADQPARNGSVIFDDGKISVKIKTKPVLHSIITKEKKVIIEKVPQKRGRKSFQEIDAETDLIEVPEDEVLFRKQYYAISEVAGWFRVNTSLLRFWENEFDILQPRKNRKGDRLFRPEDVKNLQLIYHLLRQRKYTIEGAKEYIKTNRKKADMQVQLTNTLQKFKSFLLDLKANLQP